MANLSLRHVSKWFGRQTVIDDVSPSTFGDCEFAVAGRPIRMR